MKQISGRNTEAAPMTYEVEHFPSFANQRVRLAMEAEDMNADELREAAAEVLIDTSSAKSKKQLVETVKESARTVFPSTETVTPTPDKG